MKRMLLSMLITLLIFGTQGSFVYAQTFKSNEFVTRVGDPQGPPPNITQPGRNGQKPPNTPDNLEQALLDTFGLRMVGFNRIQLNAAWEKMWDVNQTNFIKLVHGKEKVVMVQAVNSGSEQVNCGQINLRRYDDPEYLKVILIHELGHIIYWCNEDTVNKRSEHSNIYLSEGAVTGYALPTGGTTCTGQPGATENYPEMIAYYLNSGITERTVIGMTKCITRNQVPYADGKFSRHFNLVKTILGEY